MKLEKKIHAVNEVQRLMKLNFDHIMPQLQAFIGEKIQLKTGGKSAKFKIDFLDEKPKSFEGGYAQLHYCHIDISYSNIWLKISCSFKNTEVTCFYESDSIYLGDLSADKLHLKELSSQSYEPIIYEVEAVKKDIERAKQLEDELNSLNYSISKFKDLR
jgi:hypothetical protein